MERATHSSLVMATLTTLVATGCVASHDPGTPDDPGGKADIYVAPCDRDACGPPLAVAPRRCADGSLVGPEVACEEGSDGMCRWDIVQPAVCPEDMGDGGIPEPMCTEDDCGGPPLFSPRRCEDGSLVGPEVACLPGSDALCRWTIVTTAMCPEDAVDGGTPEPMCTEADCGPPPVFSPRRCEDGSLVAPEVACLPGTDAACSWTIVVDAMCPEDAD